MLAFLRLYDSLFMGLLRYSLEDGTVRFSEARPYEDWAAAVRNEAAWPVPARGTPPVPARPAGML